MLGTILLTIYIVSLVISVVLICVDYFAFDAPDLTRAEWGLVAFEVVCPILNTIVAIVAIVIVAPQIATEINNATKD